VWGVDDETSGPYERAVWAYRRVGWRGTLPLPSGRKGPPPSGFTGWAGVDPSGPDVQTWIDEGRGGGNIGVHLPPGVYGLDVDNYGSKAGGAALAGLVERCGPLPATWLVSSREDGVSGIRLYRAALPLGRVWIDEPAGRNAGIEAIHQGHRYAVVWPSTHPETGRVYRWWPQWAADVADGFVPTIDELPELPAAWIEALSRPGEVRTGDAAGHDETVTAVSAWREGDPCERVTRAAERATGGLTAAAAGGVLHPVANADVWELASLGHEGHAGVRRALAAHHAQFVAAAQMPAHGRSEPDADAEWWRLVRGAVGKLAGPAVPRCDCDLWGGVGVTFTPEDLGVCATVPPAQSPMDEVMGPPPANVTFDAGEVDQADRLIARMIGPAELRDRPAPQWLIDGLLTVDSASWLIAAPASYKSFLALDWAAHVGSGKPWHNRPVLRGGVVYVVAEGVGGMGPRIKAWEQRNGPMAPEVRFLPMPVQAARADQWAVLVEACARLRPALVILDTQARITVGLDENDNSSMSQFVEAIEALRRATGGCVLVVHHLGRSGTHARGASAIDGAQDTELRLTRTDDFRVTLRIDKSKNAADDVTVELELQRCDLGDGASSLVIGAPSLAGPGWLVADHVANLAENQATLLQVMVDIFPAMGATKAELKSEVKKRDGRGGKPMSESSYRRAWDALCDRGLFDKVGGLNGKYRYEQVTDVNA
jgi:hypothetical protein